MRDLCARDEVGVQMRPSLDPGRPNPLIYVLLKLTPKTYDGSGQKAIYFCNWALFRGLLVAFVVFGEGQGTGRV